MLGDNPERSFLGNFGLGSMPNSNFLRWWLKPSRNSLMVQRYKNMNKTKIADLTKKFCSLG